MMVSKPILIATAAALAAFALFTFAFFSSHFIASFFSCRLCACLSPFDACQLRSASQIFVCHISFGQYKPPAHLTFPYVSVL
jgi:hypothetical protein